MLTAVSTWLMFGYWTSSTEKTFFNSVVYAQGLGQKRSAATLPICQNFQTAATENVTHLTEGVNKSPVAVVWVSPLTVLEVLTRLVESSQVCRSLWPSLFVQPPKTKKNRLCFQFCILLKTTGSTPRHTRENISGFVEDYLRSANKLKHCLCK